MSIIVFTLVANTAILLQKEVSHTFWCETSFLLYRGLFALAAAYIAAVALGFSVGYEDGIAVVAHAQRCLIFCHNEAEHHLQADK